MLLSTLLSSVAVIFILKILYDRIRSPLAHLPGPEISKWTGIVTIFYWFAGKKPNYVHFLHQKYGPVVRVGFEEVDICDIDAVKVIYRARGGFLKSARFYRTLSAVETLFSTTDPAFHSAHRRLLANPISDSSLTRFEPLIADRIRLAVDKMSDEFESRGVIDVFKWWFFMATDVIGELSFGESFRMLDSGEKTQYIVDLQKLGSISPIRTTFPSLVLLASRLPLPIFRKISDIGQRLKGYAQQSIDRYKRVISESDDPKPTLFTKLYNAGKDGLSDIEIRNDAQAYIVAGSDTTAITLTYLVYSVCRDVNIREKLVAEVASLPEGYTDRALRDLPYLNQVIDETLRLHTVVSIGLPRVVPREGANLSGYQLPGGVTVTTQAYSLHRKEDIFSEPYKFNPDRWETPSKQMKDASMPFGGGSRICIGIHLARMELRLATALFFRTFPQAHVSTKEGMAHEDMEMESYFLMSPKGHRCLVEG
ncbi:cytochrome P450 [Aspergillus ruber CBS 135680]|uniref:Cytochrome P450 n=1 Tax=Aspergillus ruber (strain CBS 135680) TaxID=1388766 RepID=A0A017SM13_ASPRC|nr:cytochrome P450 [Aspergillus ruber CBS 135680]EYE97982.1 cytochrome P450 [Aspergillus ruber CBS 135680]